MNAPPTGKEKAAHVPLGYYRGGLSRKRFAWAVVLLLLGVGLAATATGGWKKAASPGPVHFAHAAWENDCSVCHAGLTQPTTARNGLNLLRRLWPDLGDARAADNLCRNCHLAPAHHGAEKPDEVGNCASCHVEHRGAQAALARVDDSACTNCHKNLAAHTTRESSRFGDVNRFATDHPPFHIGPPERRLPLAQATDPGKLLFNHALHLTTGQKASPHDRAWSLADIKDNNLRERYRREQPPGSREDASPVRLSCASCHQLDANDAPPTGVARGPGRAPGDYMGPVTYAQHCAACHPLTFDLSMPDVAAPHHLQPDALRAFLWGAYAKKMVGGPELKKQLASPRPLPGWNLSREEAEARKQVTDQVRKLESFLHQAPARRAERFVLNSRSACALCHRYGGAAVDRQPRTILATDVPQVWFPHARFSHRAHRGVACGHCHAGAEKSTSAANVLLPDVAACQRCHAPQGEAKGGLGGVRDDCVTCHRYHNGDQPLAGLGANARGARLRD